MFSSGVEPASCYQRVAGSISPGLHDHGNLGKDTEPQAAPDVLVGTLNGSHRHQCMNYCKCPKMSNVNVIMLNGPFQNNVYL